MYTHPYQIKPRIEFDAYVRNTSVYDRAFLQSSRAQREKDMSEFIDHYRQAQPKRARRPSLIARIVAKLNPDNWPLRERNRPSCSLHELDDMRA